MKYFVTNSKDLPCISESGMKSVTFKTSADLEFDMNLSLVHSDNQPRHPISILTDDGIENILLSSQKKHEATRIENNSFELRLPQDSLILIGIQGMDVLSFSGFCLS